MATRTQIETTLSDLFRILNEFHKYCSVNSARFTGTAPSHESTFRGNLQSDYHFHANLSGAVEEFRRGFDGQIGRFAELLAPGIREYGKFISAPEDDIPTILDRLYQDFFENNLFVQSRVWTFGVPTAAGGNVGNGAIRRLGYDRNNIVMEGGIPEAMTAEVVADTITGAVKHNEAFEFRGDDSQRDRLVYGGSSRLATLRALSGRDSANYISNPSFDEFAGTAAVPTDITGWSIPAGDPGIANYSIRNAGVVGTDYYRDFEGAGSPAALRYTVPGTPATARLRQLFSVRRVQLQPGTPFFFQVAVHKRTATTGGFTFRVGAATSGIVLFSAMAADWNIIMIPGGLTWANPGGANQNWYDFFGDSDPKVEIEFSAAMTAGQHCDVDDIVFAPFQEFNNLWYAPVGGSTKWLRQDKFTWTDTATDAAIIQKWLARIFGKYLPHAVGTTQTTWDDPT